MVVAYRIVWNSAHSDEPKSEEGILQNVPPGAADKAVHAIAEEFRRRPGSNGVTRISYQAAENVVDAMIAITRLI